LSSLLKYQAEAEPTSLNGFFEILKKSNTFFNYIKRKEIITIKLFKLKQTKGIESYYNTFRKLSYETDINEENLLFLFTDGVLYHRAKCEILFRKPKTLVEAFEIARDIELCIEKIKMNQRESEEQTCQQICFIEVQKKLKNVISV